MRAPTAKVLQLMKLIVYLHSCSASHIPGYIGSPQLASAGQVFVVSVNDPFVYGCLSAESSALSYSLGPTG